MKATRAFLSAIPIAAAFCFFVATGANPGKAQGTSLKAGEKAADKAPEKDQEKPAAKPAPKLPAEIELLETRIRVETDGGSCKEVHARVKINDELGVRQFARLNFNFNRSFEQVEIPLVRITHASGGTADVLPSAITDNPNPAIVNAPAYQDVRVKSVRILGLEPGDSLEYRVVTTVSHHPFAPDFWLEHTFDRSGVVSREIFIIDTPASRLRMRINPNTPAIIEKSGEGETSRVSYRWELQQEKQKPQPTSKGEADIVLTTFSSWSRLSSQIAKREYSGFSTTIYQEADALGGSGFKRGSAQSLYRLVSEKIATIDIPFEFSVSVSRGVEQVLKSGYGTSEEKARLLSILMTQLGAQPRIVMYGHGGPLEAELPRPNLLAGTIVVSTEQQKQYFLDPGLEVAPFGAFAAKLRGQKSLNIAETSADSDDCFTSLPVDLRTASSQSVNVQASLTSEGKLTAKVKYVMRGDNELLLRVAFHQAPKKDWKNVAQLLALSDGFRGEIANVTASDPYATLEPFTVEYEITQPKFVDWSKKQLRVPALLPLIGMPDPPAKTPAAAASPIDLGTPLEVELAVTLHLPAGTTTSVPAGTSVARDFATYSSQYAAKDLTLTAMRHLNFILKEIPAERAADYDAFLRTVQNDESQSFTIERSNAGATPSHAVPSTTSKPQKP